MSTAIRLFSDGLKSVATKAIVGILTVIGSGSGVDSSDTKPGGLKMRPPTSTEVKPDRNMTVVVSKLYDIIWVVHGLIITRVLPPP